MHTFMACIFDRRSKKRVVTYKPFFSIPKNKKLDFADLSNNNYSESLKINTSERSKNKEVPTDLNSLLMVFDLHYR
jgi:hypothetical protein